MKVPTLDKLLEDQLKDIHSAESQLLKALPKMAKAASTPALKAALTAHLEETRGQVERLTRVGEHLGIAKLTGKKCAAMEGLIEEGKEALEMEAPPAILDLAIIAAAQRVEHYEMAAYGTARAIAEHLGHGEVVKLLQETLDQESAADEKLTAVASDAVFPSIKEGPEDEVEDDEDEDEKPAPKKKATPTKAARK